MALATVTGSVVDLTNTSMGNRSAEIVFEMDEQLVLANGGLVIPNEPIKVKAAADGTFSVRLQPSLETNPYCPYRVTINWLSGKSSYKARARKFHIVVPAGGGQIDDMIGTVSDGRIVTKGDTGPAGSGGSLSADTVRSWKADTDYAKSARVASPRGDIVKAKVAHKSTQVYDSTKWEASVQDSRIRALEITGTGGGTTIVTGTAGEAARRPLIGARVGVGSTVSLPDSQYWDALHDLESVAKTQFDISNWYRSISPTSAEDFIATVVPELAAYPTRRINYVFEIHKNNSQFNKEFNEQSGIYPDLVETLLAIKNSGYMDRVTIAPFHEGNGGGGSPGSIGSYPWHAYDTDQELFDGVMTRVNTPAKYKEAFRNVVSLARSLGVTSKFIQWYLAANTSDATDVDGVSRMDMANLYVGDTYADIVGLSYYNRSGDSRYSNTWPEPGANGLREFYNAYERMTGRPLWLCETGCAATNVYGDQAQWYADLVKLIASDEMPRVEGMIMFMQNSTQTVAGVEQGADMRLANDPDKRLVGRAVNAARRTNKANPLPQMGRSLLPISVTDVTTTAGWTKSTGVVLATSNDYTPDLDKMINGLRVYKPAFVTGDTLTSHNLYRQVSKSNTDYDPNDPYVLQFYARASYEGFRVEAGIRQDGGAATTLGDELSLSTVFEQYVVPFSSQTDDPLLTGWRMPNFNFGNNQNTTQAWFDIAAMRISRGSYAQPNIERLARPKVRAITNAANLTWNCEAATIHTVTIAQNVTIMAPFGVAYDGQEISLRIKQDGTGGRTINLHSAFYSSTAAVSQTTLPGSVTILKFQYDEGADRWGLVETVLWGLT